MFEGSLVESRGLVASTTQRWTALGSLALQCAVAALLIAIPMLRPEVLPVSLNAPHITVPKLRQTQVVQQVARAAASAAAAMTAPTTAPVVEQTRRFVFPLAPSVDDGVVPPTGPTTMPFGNGQGLAPLAVIGRPAVVPRVRDVGPVRISKGVSQGLLLTRITPVYPAIAKAARVQGAVVIDAVISKMGRVESLNVVSGPDLLRRAAVDAVSAARYAPYRLSGEPVDVQTVITVVFRLGV